VASRRDLVISFLLLAASPGWSFLLAPNVAAQSASPSKPPEAEIITIHPHGFDPSEIHRPAARILLVVNNRSGVSDLHLRLDRVAGQREREVRVRRGKLEWRDYLELVPGRYRLTEVNHPAWICEIVISNGTN
jgi:hypothetical protein